MFKNRKKRLITDKILKIDIFVEFFPNSYFVIHTKHCVIKIELRVLLQIMIKKKNSFNKNILMLKKLTIHYRVYPIMIYPYKNVRIL